MHPEQLADGISLYNADCREVLRELPDSSIDSVVTDPPYALVSISKRYKTLSARDHLVTTKDPYRRTGRGFMGKEWDTGETAFAVEFWAEVLRVLKPGGHVVAFAGTRTYHRLAVAIEDAGFEIRDQLQWIFGVGFPKSLNVSKQIDKAAGAEREVIGTKPTLHRGVSSDHEYGFKSAGDIAITAPATEQAVKWDGWHTALKPAHEPICLARKPLSEGTVAANVLRWGVGALNIDGCRVWGDTSKTDTGCSLGGKAGSANLNLSMSKCGKTSTAQSQTGLISITEMETRGIITPKTCNCSLHSNTEHCICENTLAEKKTSPRDANRQGNAESEKDSTRNGLSGNAQEDEKNITASKGRWPANLLLDGSEEVVGMFPKTVPSKASAGRNGKDIGDVFSLKRSNDEVRGHSDNGGSAARFFYSAKASKADRAGSKHPTVKPIALMQWLCRLITPPGGTILDPFAGSGTTGAAAHREGFKAILCEREAEYAADIRSRFATVDKTDGERKNTTAESIDEFPLFGGGLST